MVETCNSQKVTALLVWYLREDLRHPLFQSVQGFLKEDNEHTMWLVIVKNCRYAGVCFYTHLNQANTDWCKPVMRENAQHPLLFQTPSLKKQKNFCLPQGKHEEARDTSTPTAFLHPPQYTSLPRLTLLFSLRHPNMASSIYIDTVLYLLSFP